MKKNLLFITFILMGTCFQLNAQTITWTGGAGTTDWNTAGNWEDTSMVNRVPIASDDVDLDGNTVILASNTTVQRVYAGGSSNLTINSGITLTITGFAGGDDGLEVQNSATVVNNGTIAISNIDVASTDADGLYNKGTFTNNGSITITNTGQHGIYLQQGTFTNSTTGTITITNTGQNDTGADYIYMDDNSGTPAIFHNHGDVDITMTGNDDGIYIKDGSALTNHSTGTIDIISTGGGDMPLHLVGLTGTGTATTLTNDGAITINGTGTTDYGIQIDGANTTPVATIINSGTLTVLNGTNDAIRIRRGGAFTNSSSGTLTITEPGDEAIQIDSEANTVFNNSGTVDITGDIANTNNHGIELSAAFNNLAGGVLTVKDCGSDGMRIKSTGVFTNDGDINMYNSDDNDIETDTGGSFTNSGTATFSPGSKTASTYGVTNIKKDFNLGSATVTFQIGGTTAGTEYDQIENKDNANTITITGATAHLDWGTYIPNVGDEFKIMDESGTVAGPFASVTNSNADIVYTVDYASNTDEVKIVVTDINSTWTGNTDSDWDTAGNWSTIVPTVATDVTIPSGLTNYPTASGAVTTNSITMAAGTSFIANSTVTGNVTYSRSIGTTNWYLIGSPVVGQDEDDFATAAGLASGSVSNLGLGSYNTSDNTWSYYDGTASANTLINGQGYSLKLASAGNIAFTGTMLTSDLTPITLTTTGDGFNLAGNPYPSYINSATMLSTSTASLDSQTIWVWNQATSMYDPKVFADTFQIAPGQGFFVKSNGAAGTLAINEAFQSHQGADTFQKGNSRSEVHLTLTDGANTRLAKLYYIDGTTTGFDNGYDGPMFSGVSNPFAVYTQSINSTSGRDLGIQSLPKDYESLIVPVGVNAEKGKEITFSAEAFNLPNGINAYLEDRLENTYTRLDEANAYYKVTLTEVLNGVGRFYLHTSSSSVLNIDDNLVLDNISIFKTYESNLRIVGLEQGDNKIKIYNILGKQIMSTSFKANGIKDISLPNFASGVYIVQLETETGKLNKKIIIE